MASFEESVRLFKTAEARAVDLQPGLGYAESKLGNDLELQEHVERIKSAVQHQRPARRLAGSAHRSSLYDADRVEAAVNLDTAESDQVQQRLKFREQEKPKRTKVSGTVSLDIDVAQTRVASYLVPADFTPRSEEALACRLFRHVKVQPASNFIVQMESEFSSAQKQHLEKASAAGQAQQQSKSTFLDLSADALQMIAVSGATVQAYASLAAKTAAKRVRPVSKQVNLGPRKVIRCGWGGQGPGPLELLAKQQRAQTIFESLMH